MWNKVRLLGETNLSPFFRKRRLVFSCCRAAGLRRAVYAGGAAEGFVARLTGRVGCGRRCRPGRISHALKLVFLRNRLRRRQRTFSHPVGGGFGRWALPPCAPDGGG